MSERIKDLVEEIFGNGLKIKNSPILEGDRANFHFTLHNLDYTKEKKEVEIEKETEVFNYKDYITFVAETFEHKTDTKFVKIGEKEYKMTYEIEKKKKIFSFRNS